MIKITFFECPSFCQKSNRTRQLNQSHRPQVLKKSGFRTLSPQDLEKTPPPPHDTRPQYQSPFFSPAAHFGYGYLLLQSSYHSYALVSRRYKPTSYTLFQVPTPMFQGLGEERGGEGDANFPVYIPFYHWYERFILLVKQQNGVSTQH